MTNVPIEAGIGSLWFAKQTGLGTQAAVGAASTIRPRWASGAFKSGKTNGSEEYVDGQRFGSPAIYVDRLAGDAGSIVIQAQPETVGPLSAWILGVDTVTGAGDPWTHTMTSAGTTGLYLTARQSVGVAVGPVKEAFWDAKIAKLTLEASVDQKVMHVTADMMALKASEAYTTAPSAAEATTDPYYWTEVVGAAKIDTVVTNETHGETLEIDTKMAPYYGDNTEPICLVEGKGEIMRSIKTICTDDTLANYQKALYGAAGTPAPGVRPVNLIYYANIDTKYTKSATRTLQITTPRVAVETDNLLLAPLPDGGTIELTFGGKCLKSGATPALTMVALSGDSTTYA